MSFSYFVAVWFVMLSISQRGNVLMKKSVCFMNIYENFHSLLLGTQNCKIICLNTESKGRNGSAQLYLLSPAYFVKVVYGNC